MHTPLQRHFFSKSSPCHQGPPATCPHHSRPQPAILHVTGCFVKRRARIQQLPFASLVPMSTCMHARTFRHTPRADTQGCPELMGPRHAQPPAAAAATHVDQTWVPSLGCPPRATPKHLLQCTAPCGTTHPASTALAHITNHNHTPHSSDRKAPITQQLAHSGRASGTLASPQHALIAVNSNNPHRGVGVRSTRIQETVLHTARPHQHQTSISAGLPTACINTS